MSDKPIAERMQVKGIRRLAVIGAPIGVDSIIGVPERRAAPHEAEVVVLFATSRGQLDAGLAGLLPELRHDAILWIAYPKLTSRFASDLSRDVIRDAAPANGLEVVSQIAMDHDWSALRMKRLP